MKPGILYHGSPCLNLEVLEPREDSPGHKLPGRYVFATQHRQLAAMFLAPKVAPMQMSQFHDTYSLIVNGTQSDFQVADHGGAIYELPAATFQQGPSDMPEIEWFSKQAVHPRHTEVFPSSLTAMHHYGVNVYFVDAATYAAIQAAADHGWQILQSLTPFRP